MEVAITEFFSIATELYHQACNNHERDTSPDKRLFEDIDTVRAEKLLTSCIDNLSSSVDAVSNSQNDFPSGQSITVLAYACRKVSRDLLIRLDRIRHISIREEPKFSRFTEFRTAWKRNDVIALGNRLRELGQQWTEIFPPSK